MRSFKLLACLFVAAVLWTVLPLLATATVGTWWIYREGWIWWFLGATAVTSLTGTWLVNTTFSRLRNRVAAVPPPAACGTVLAEEARRSVRTLAQRLSAEEPDWQRPEAIGKAVLDVLDCVSRHYFPKSDEPILERPLPHVLGTVELAMCDVRRLVAEQVPFGTQITLKGWMHLKSLHQAAWPMVVKGYRAYRVARLANPIPAVAREGVDWLSRKLLDRSVAQTRQWFVEEMVVRIGDYAIQLYSGELVFSDESRDRVSPAVASTDFPAEPIQVLVAGQTKAGKSSVVNALLGEPVAPVDVLPATDRIDLYECSPEGLTNLVLRDTPGYSGIEEGSGDALAELHQPILDCDLLVLVCSAQSAARRDDARMLHSVRAIRPAEAVPVVCVVTHVDGVPEPLRDELVEAVAADLGLAANRVVLVCVKQGREQNIEAIPQRLRDVMAEAERLKQRRCIRQIRKAQDETTLWENLRRFGRLGLGWVQGARKSPSQAGSPEDA